MMKIELGRGYWRTSDICIFPGEGTDLEENDKSDYAGNTRAVSKSIGSVIYLDQRWGQGHEHQTQKENTRNR